MGGKDRMKQQYVMSFIDFGLKTKEEMDEIEVKTLDKIMNKLDVEILSEDASSSRNLNNNRIFILMKKNREKEKIGELELRCMENLSVGRNECILKLDKSHVKYRGWLFSESSSIFDGIIEILNPRFAFIDLVENNWRLFKKERIINSKKIKNSITRINYFRDDIVGQLRLMEIIVQGDKSIKRIYNGVKFSLDLRFDNEENKKIVDRIKETECIIKKYWDIKRYKVLRKGIYDGEIIYNVWDGVEDKVFDILYRNTELQLAKFYNLKINQATDLIDSDK